MKKKMTQQTTKKMVKQMLKLFSKYIQNPWSSNRMHNVEDVQYNIILDAIKEDGGQGRLMSILLENFIRLLGTNVEKEAANGKWIDRLDKNVNTKQLIWKQEKYIAACNALYHGINQYIENMVSQYQQQHPNMDQKYKPNWMRFRVNIDAELFKGVLSTQQAMTRKCQEIHLYNNQIDVPMDKYIAITLKFMMFSVFLMISNCINFEFKQKEKQIEYEPNIRDVFYPKHSKSLAFTPSNGNSVNYFSSFNQPPFSLENNTLQCEYQSEWIGHNESFYDVPESVQSVYKPLNTDKALVPIFKTLIDYSVSLDQSSWTNLSADNQFYDIWMNKECVDMVKYVIDNDLEHSLFITNYFHSSYNPKDIKASNGAIRLMEDPNAGGNSQLSEAFSYEILKQCFQAKLLKTEMEIKYKYKNCKITDYLASFNGKRMGVSVTRAYKHIGEFNQYDGLKLLNKKINGINESSQNVIEQDSFSRQILHIWATDENIKNPKEKDILFQIFKELLLRNPRFTNNTIFIVTGVSLDCWWIFRQNKLLRIKDSNNKKRKKKKKKKKKYNDNAISI